MCMSISGFYLLFNRLSQSISFDLKLVKMMRLEMNAMAHFVCFLQCTFVFNSSRDFRLKFFCARNNLLLNGLKSSCEFIATALTV
jgi:hypothetical protein